MSVLKWFGENVGIINKVKSIPTAKSNKGIYFVSNASLEGVYIVSDNGGTKSVIRIFDSRDYDAANLAAGIIFQDMEVQTVSDLDTVESPRDKWGVYVISEDRYYRYDISTQTWSRTPFNHIPSDVVLRDEIVDDLTSTDTDLPLSANQGFVIGEMLSHLGYGENVHIGKTNAYSYLYFPHNGRLILTDDVGGLNTAVIERGLSYEQAQSVIDSEEYVAEAIITSGDIIDDLTSVLTDSPLSANQGRILNEKLLELGSGESIVGSADNYSFIYSIKTGVAILSSNEDSSLTRAVLPRDLEKEGVIDLINSGEYESDLVLFREDVVSNLQTPVSDRPLSASMGQFLNTFKQDAMPDLLHPLIVGSTGNKKISAHYIPDKIEGFANTDSPEFTGTPTAPTPDQADESTKIATTAFVAQVLTKYAALASPTFTGTPKAPTAAPEDASTRIATTAFVTNAVDGLKPSIENANTVATDAYESAETANNAIAELENIYAKIASPSFTGRPTAPTPETGNNSSLIATTAFVTNSIVESGGVVKVWTGEQAVSTSRIAFPLSDVVKVGDSIVLDVEIAGDSGNKYLGIGNAMISLLVPQNEGYVNVNLLNASNAVVAGRITATNTDSTQSVKNLEFITDGNVSITVRGIYKLPAEVGSKINVTDIVPGMNIRGITIEFTNTDKRVPPIVPSEGYGLLTGSVEEPTWGIGYLNYGGILIAALGEDGNFDPIFIDNIAEGGEYDQVWLKTVVTVPDDKDYIVVQNDLPAHEGDDWGFDYTIVTE